MNFPPFVQLGENFASQEHFSLLKASKMAWITVTLIYPGVKNERKQYILPTLMAKKDQEVRGGC